MIKIYHTKGTRGLRVIWLCEELNIDYQIQKVDFSKEFRFSKEWLKINPLGKFYKRPCFIGANFVDFLWPKVHSTDF